MKKLNYILIALSFVAMANCSGCKTKVKPVSELIAKVWSAQKVEEGSAVVFTKGAATNVRAGYTNFRLDLTNATTVSYRDWDNTSFSGQWELQGDTRLVLKNLTPVPTGTTGTIEFTISPTPTETEFIITRTTGNQKTGGTVNKYTLSNP